ncbi:MAG: hypothetical protein M1831_001131 [Alyxoria varia]|nr:MAG: hypothetical protein M1831_001131 [Alyxoria varia]
MPSGPPTPTPDPQNPNDTTADATKPEDPYPQQCLLAAAHHDVPTLRRLLDSPPESMTSVEAANVVDPETGWTLLHAAVVAFDTKFPKARMEETRGDVDVAENGGRGVDGSEDGERNGQQRLESQDVGHRGRQDLGSKDTAHSEQQAPEIEEREKLTQQAEETLHLLLQNGAIWNVLDLNDKTPGCLAHANGFKKLYDILVEAGVRAELLFGKLDEYEVLDGEESDEDEVGEDEAVPTDGEGKTPGIGVTRVEDGSEAMDTNGQKADALEEEELTNEKYLSKPLTFQTNRILDSDNNAVMMEWERNIMRRTVESLLPIDRTEQEKPVKQILNIGHGLGIISSLFLSHARADKQPVVLHIVEPHPDVLAKIRGSPDSWLDAELAKAVRSFREYDEPQAPLPKPPGYGRSDVGDDASPDFENLEVVLHPNTWQTVLPRLVTDDVTFDAIFFDTFAEDYKAFKEFFSEHVIGLLKQNGRWSFFHGLGADRQICYDVYTKVLECDLMEAGFDVEWESLNSQEGTQGWEGVRRKYWALDKYRLPICTFLD